MPFETVVDQQGNEVLQYVMPTEEKEDDLDKKDTELINEVKDTKLINEANNRKQQGYIPPTPKEYIQNHPLKPIVDWTVNTARAGVGKFGQEFLVDYPNDFYENQKLNPNSLRNNPRAILGEDFKVENDNLWVIDQNGDQRSLKTGQKYVKGYLKSLLNFTDIADRNELIEYFNNNPDRRISHPALVTANERREFLTAYNADKDPDQRIGPTGDFGVPVDKKFFGKTIKQRLTPKDGYEHGEETVGTILSYLVPTALLMWGTRGVAKNTLPSSVHALPGRLMTKAEAIGGVRGKFLSKFIKGAVEGAVEGGAVAYVMDANPEGDGTFLGIGRKVDVTDDNETRRRIGRTNDYLLGGIFGEIIEFGVPISKAAARGSSNFVRGGGDFVKGLGDQVITKGKEIVGSAADPIADIIYKTGKFIVDRQNFEIAEDQLKVARELQAKGPTDVKKVVPTTTVKRTDPMEFYRNRIEKEDVIQQKATQKELDDQVAKAEEIVEKQRIVVDQDAADLAITADNVIDTTEVVDDVPNVIKQAKEGSIQKALRENNRKIAQSDARTLRGIERTFQEVDEIKPKKAGRRKIEPGTPHPTDPNKVRSNNGRWVTKAYYDKVNKALAGAEEIKKEVGSTFYHGTSKNNMQEVSGADVQLYGPGVYLTSSKKAASRHGSNVLKTQIDRNNLVDLGEFPKGNIKAINDL